MLNARKTNNIVTNLVCGVLTKTTTWFICLIAGFVDTKNLQTQVLVLRLRPRRSNKSHDINPKSHDLC